MDYRLNMLHQAAYCFTQVCSGMTTVPLRPKQKLGVTLWNFPTVENWSTKLTVQLGNTDKGLRILCLDAICKQQEKKKRKTKYFYEFSFTVPI